MSVPSHPNWPRTDLALLLAMMLVWWLWMPWSAVHLDFSRDLALAADILGGAHFPLSGPLLAGWAQLGPVWYYFLASVLWVGQDYFGVVLLLGLLASSQFLLVYRLGCEWAGREAGLIWAALLLVPSWSLYESVLVSHTLFAPVLVAMGMLAGLRWMRQGRGLDLVLLAMSCSLAVHAHPSTLALMPMAAMAAIIGARHGRRLRAWGAALLVAGIPFLPMLWEQLQTGWPLLSAARDYRASAEGEGALTAVPAIIWQLSLGGLGQWLGSVFGWSQLSVSAAQFAYALIILAGLGGLLFRIRAGCYGDVLAVSGFALALIMLSLLRSVYPYWFLSGVEVLWLGLIAVGFAELLRGNVRSARIVMPIACLLVLTHGVVLAAGVTLQRAGSWPFAALPTFDVTSASQPHQAMPFLSARASRNSGRWLCRFPDVAIHGPLAQSLAMSYAVQRRLQCGDGPVHISGTAVGRDHWAGLSRQMLGALAVEPENAWTGWGLVRVQPLWPPEEGVLPGVRPYPHLPLPSLAPIQLELELEASDDGSVLVFTHLGFLLSARPQPQLLCADERVLPVASDLLSDAFSVPACPGSLRLLVSVPDPSHVSIFLISDW